MRILQITSSFYPLMGGMEKVVFETSKELSKLGHDVTVLTTNLFCEDKNLPREEMVRGFKIVRLNNNLLLKGYGYSAEAKKWIEDHWKEFDIVHSHGYNRFLSEFSLKYLNKKLPTIFSAHGFIHTKKNYIFKKIHDVTLGKYLKFANALSALTPLDYKEYIKLGVDKKNIFDLPNGVDIANFKKKSSKQIENFKTKFDLDKKTLLYVGRIHKSKGLQYVLRSIQNIDCKLLVVGQDVGYKADLLKISKELGISNKIIFAGCVNDEDLVKAYYASDAFILFSEWEGFGVVIVEAMAAGKPLIVSDRGSLPFLVNDGLNGIVVPFKNVKKLNEGISSLIENDSLMKKYGCAGKKMSENYSWSLIVKKLIKKYEEILKK